MSQGATHRQIEFRGMILIVCVIASVIWYFRMPRAQPRSTTPLSQQKPGDVLKSITMKVDHSPSGGQKVLLASDRMTLSFDQKKLIRDCLVKNRHSLPEKYVAGLLWTETEVILVIVPTGQPITLEQVNGFLEIIWECEKNLGDPLQQRDVVISDGPLKGGHGVALPLRTKTIP